MLSRRGFVKAGAAISCVLLALGAGPPPLANAASRRAATRTIRYQFGDDPRWADPALDDGAWPVLRADLDGTLTVANAGHIAPYLNGKELAVDNGLPLGLSSESVYLDSTCRLERDVQITLLTDGVVEARNASGELFGFERTAASSTQSAEAIARAAQAFGQDDDITVLSLTFAPIEVAHA